MAAAPAGGQPSLQAPAGRVRLSPEPIQIDNATIVIDNPRLVDYLTPLGSR